MNHCYRLVWSTAHHTFIAVSEIATGRGKSSGGKAPSMALSAVTAALLGIAGTSAHAAGANICGSGAISVNTAQANDDFCVLPAGASLTVGTQGSFNSGTETAVVVNTGVGATSITNSGSITSASLLDGSSVPLGTLRVSGSLSGALLNTGTISNTGSSGFISGAGLVLNEGTVSGGLINRGLINATAGFGVYTDDDVVITNGFLNDTSGTINGGEFSVYMQETTLSGGFVNRGTLSGARVDVVRFSVATLDSFTHAASGLITSNQASGVSFDTSSVSGNIDLLGDIVAGDDGVRMDATTVGGRVFVAAPIVAQGDGFLIEDTTVVGGLYNQSTISGGDNGIAFEDDSTMSITNAGTIHGDDAGVYISQASVSGRIVNLAGGVITGGSDGGIYLYEYSVLSDGITNAGRIEGDNGIFISSEATVGGITNSGTILGTSGDGIKVYSSSAVVGSIVNSGLIEGDNGIFVSSESVLGGVTNSGTIRGSDGRGIQFLDRSTITGSLVNLAGGTISGTAEGIWLSTSSSISGSLVNAGLIQGRDESGIYLSGSTIGSLVNQSGGTITGGTHGVQLSASSVVNSITNAGRMQGADRGVLIQAATINTLINTGTISGGNVGIGLEPNGEVTGFISNSGVITGGSQALSLLNGTASLTVNNSGTLQGNVEMGSMNNVLNLNGNSARVIGNITNVSQSGVININGDFTSEGAINVGTINVNSGGTFNVSQNLTGGMTVNSGGKLNVGANNVSLQGGYSLNGRHVFSLSSANTYGKLNAQGNVVLSNGSEIEVRTTGSPGSRIDGVIVASGSLTNSGINVIDNNLLYNFVASTTRNAQELDLVSTPDSQGIASAGRKAVNPGVGGVAQALQTMFNTGVPAGMQPVFDALNAVSSENAEQALTQMLPSVQGAGSQAGVNALRSMNKIVQARVESNQGLSSGNTPAERYIWVRGFGSWAEQDNHKGVSGFDSKTQGLVVGGDRPINDKVRAGLAFTHARSNIDSKSATAPSTVKVDTYELVGYGSYNISPLTDVNVQVDFGKNDARSSRLSFGGGQAKADFSSIAMHTSVGIGRVFVATDHTTVTPSVRVDYTNMKTDGYTESGSTLSGANLAVKASRFEELLFTSDVKVTHLINTNLKFVGNFTLGYDAYNQQVQTSSAFVGGGPTFKSQGLQSSPWLYRIGLGLMHDNQKGVEYSARYDCEAKPSGYLNQTLSARVRWAF